MQGFHRTYETGAACQQRTLTPPDTWSCPTFGLACVLMSRPISPELVLFPDFWVSNIPRYFSFAFDYLRNIALIWILQLNSKQMSKVYHDGDWDLRLCSIVFFFQPRRKRRRKLNQNVHTFTIWHIHINIGINKKAIFSSFHWYGAWLAKNYSHFSGIQRHGRGKFDVSFSCCY